MMLRPLVPNRAAVTGNRLRLAVPTAYPALKGWGYLLVGQPWMLDRPRE